MKKNLKNFKEYCGGSLAALVGAVKFQSGAGSVSEFFDYLENVTASPCGAAAGFTGFIYYSETVSFWRVHRAQITAYMRELAASLGESYFDMVCSFNCLHNYEQEEIGRALFGRYDEELTHIYNVFALFALEEVANRFSDFSYECN